MHPLALASWTVILAALVAPAIAGAAQVNGSMRVLTDYVYRSYSLSSGGAAIQGQVSALFAPRWFAGLGASSVAVGDATLEITPYVGVNLFRNADWRISATLGGYLYDGTLGGHAGHYAAPSTTISYRDVAALHLGVAVNEYGFDESACHIEGTVRYPLNDVSQIDASLGHDGTRALAGADYLYWNLGVTHYLSSHWALDLRYYGSRSTSDLPLNTQGHDFFDAMEIRDRVVFSASFGF